MPTTALAALHTALPASTGISLLLPTTPAQHPASPPNTRTPGTTAAVAVTPLAAPATGQPATPALLAQAPSCSPTPPAATAYLPAPPRATPRPVRPLAGSATRVAVPAAGRQPANAGTAAVGTSCLMGTAGTCVPTGPTPIPTPGNVRHVTQVVLTASQAVTLLALPAQLDSTFTTSPAAIAVRRE